MSGATIRPTAGPTTGTAFTTARAEGRAALIGYLPVGFPDVEGSIAAMRTLVENGWRRHRDRAALQRPGDGRPHHPGGRAAGPRDGHPHRRRLPRGRGGRRDRRAAGGDDLLEPGRALRRGPLRPRPRQRWGAGLITPDLVPDEADHWVAVADELGLDKVFLVAPSSTDERLAMTTASSRGFVYAAAVMGVTGARESSSDLAGPLVERVKSSTDLPVGVGIGVSEGAQAAEVARFADGVIVGSAFVRRLLDAGTDRGAGLASVAELTRDLADGVRRG